MGRGLHRVGGLLEAQGPQKVDRQHPDLRHQGLEAQGRRAGQVRVARDGGLHRVVQGVGQALLGAPALGVHLGPAVAVIPDPPLVGVGDQEDRVLLAQPGAEVQGLGAVRIDRRQRRRVSLAVDQRQENAARQPRLVEDVLEHAQVEVDAEILPLPLEVGLVDGDRPRVGGAGLRRRVLLDLLGGVVREQQDQIVELVGERLEALVAAGGERELAPLVLGRRAQPVAAVPHEHRPHRAPADRREEMERPGVELEPEGVPLQHQAADRHRPAVRPRRAQGGVGGVHGRRSREGEQQKRQQNGQGKETAHDTTSLKEFLPPSIRAKSGRCFQRAPYSPLPPPPAPASPPPPSPFPPPPPLPPRRRGSYYPSAPRCGAGPSSPYYDPQP